MYKLLISISVLLFPFILTSCVQRPKAMDIFKPSNKKHDKALPVPEYRTMTILLGDKNKVLYYLGNPDKPIAGPAVTGYGKDSLDKVINGIMRKVQKDTTENYLIILVKPSDKSTYQNFVRTIDIINVAGVESYGVVDITSKDVEELKKCHAY